MKRVTSQPILPQAGFEGALLRLLREYSDSINQAADHKLSEFVSITGSYTAGENDHIIKCAPSAPMTVTLPSAASMRNKRIVVKRTNDTTHIVTIQSTSGDIDNAATTLLTTAYQSKELFSDGTAWWLLDGCCNNPSGEVFSSIGALIAGSAEIAGTATHLALHTATGAMVSQSATVDGVAASSDDVILLIQGGADGSLTLQDLSNYGDTATINNYAEFDDAYQVFTNNTIKTTTASSAIDPFSSTGANERFSRDVGSKFTIECFVNIVALENVTTSSFFFALFYNGGRVYEVGTYANSANTKLRVRNGDLTEIATEDLSYGAHFVQMNIDGDSYTIDVDGTEVYAGTNAASGGTGEWQFQVASQTAAGLSSGPTTEVWVTPLRVTRNVLRARGSVPTSAFPIP